MYFDVRKKFEENEVTLCGDRFDVCTSFKYLGQYLSYNLSDSEDISIRLKSLYRRFFSIKSNFSKLSEDIVLFLFKSFCMIDFGLNIWNLKDVNRRDFKAFEIGYLKCIKSIYGLNKYASTHFTFNACNMLIFSHLVHFFQCRYFKRIFNDPRGLIYLIPTLKGGTLVNSITRLVKKHYNITIFDNDIDAIKARIIYVQMNERNI